MMTTATATARPRPWQAWGDIKQQADGIGDGDGRVDFALDLPASIGVEQGAAGGQLAEEGDGQDGADTTELRAHKHLQK